MKTKALVLSTLVLAACESAPEAEMEVTREASRYLSGVQEVVGVTVEPTSGTTYVLDVHLGLLRLGTDSFEVVLSSAELGYRAFSDVVALGGGRFAVTVPNDGLLLDLTTGTLEPFFCYQPLAVLEEFPDATVEQFTESLAYDADLGVLVAQPRTLVTENGERRIERAEVGFFDATLGGEGYGWISVDRELLAGGIAFDGARFILLGVEGRIHRLDRNTGDLTLHADLNTVGIDRVDGLSRRPDGTFWVLSRGALHAVRLTPRDLE